MTAFVRNMTTGNILIADDDPSIIMIVNHIVRRAGFAPLTARDGFKL